MDPQPHSPPVTGSAVSSTPASRPPFVPTPPVAVSASSAGAPTRPAVVPAAGAGAGAGSSGGISASAPVSATTKDELLLPGFLFTFASPLVDDARRALDNLDHASEREILLETLRLASKRLRFTSRVATRANLLHLVVARSTFRVLHYSGHGMASGLVFETEDGQADKLNCSELSRFLGGGDGLQVKLAFVSACYSESIGETFVAAGVPHVVAVRWDQEVPDAMCQAFERGFYTVLFEGNTVSQAFRMAELFAKVTPGHFCLLPKDANHDETIFPDAASGAYVDSTPALPTNTCDTVPAYLIGRNRTVQRVVELLTTRKHRCVILRGEPGIGKTCVALKAAEFMNTRSMFPNGVFMVSMGGSLADPIGAATPAAGAGTAAAATPPRVAVHQRVAQALGLASARSEHDVLDALAKLSENGRLLLVLDDCPSPAAEASDGSPKSKAAGYRGRGGSVDDDDSALLLTFINNLQRMAPKVSLLLTAEASINGGHMFDAPKIIPVEPLTPMESAKLFASLFPRNLKLREMGATSVDTAIPQFAETAIIKQLQGHPRAIAFAAAQLGDEDLSTIAPSVIDRIVSEAKQADFRNLRAPPLSVAPGEFDLPDESPLFDKSASTDSGGAAEVLAVRRHMLEIEVSSTLKDMNARRLWMSIGPKELVTWLELQHAIDESYRERVPRAAYLRELTSEDHAFLRAKCMKEAGCDFDTTMLDIAGFAKFWSWLGPVLDVISRLHRLWSHTDPILLRGFVDKAMATTLLLPALRDGVVGAFLVRFSDGRRPPARPGWLALSYVCFEYSTLVIRHTAIEPVPDGFAITFQSRTTNTYATLQELLMDVERLVVLYPVEGPAAATGIPKATAFGSVDVSGPYQALPSLIHAPAPPSAAMVSPGGGRFAAAAALPERSLSWRSRGRTGDSIATQDNEP